MPDDLAFIVQSLVRALSVDNDVDLIQKIPEGKFFLFQYHSSGLDAAHIQNIVDQAEQMLGTRSDLFQLFTGMRSQIRIPQRNIIQTDDRVHRCADLMAHIGKKTGFGPAALFSQYLFRFDLFFTFEHGRKNTEKQQQYKCDHPDQQQAVI